ncbi:DUF7684 family protein [Kordiimonas laminariae]|uniref:DUF7684 family protein n=1 Tax=Kordiimonas laminariae TaxID=2917717 RepID=UPI001FF0E042|nr:hypothetical protein [Kordiimonas laminariae]MCK0068003.1 hypothetical protein [Kordiimonas laminariae]
MDNMVQRISVVEVESITADMLPSSPYCIAIEADFEMCGNEARWALAELLVKTDVMWVAGVGNQSSLLDDDVDMVCVNRQTVVDNDYIRFPDVMTTWHDDEPLEDVLEFMAITEFDFKEVWGVSKWDIIAIKVG